ncbi:hypothetical protein [Glycomyces dulcitolivorans]|uniref:hypothetical protein n=1 Tax=Glycomyces dulcitolivorans TaxID=2200759 RepID=UPI0018E58B27|nr:hypothetical protein [Glycomyces dulcitolivorans]
MKWTFRRSRLASVLATLAIAAGIVFAVGSPAQARVVECTDWDTNEKTFNLPGKPDVTVNAIVCIENNGADYYAAWITVYWDGGNVNLYGDRFDKFKPEVYRERNQKIQGTVYSCDFTGEINNLTEASDDCLQPFKYYNTNGSWTGDGWIIYNINDDGNGDYYWYLTGSPSVP